MKVSGGRRALDWQVNSSVIIRPELGVEGSRPGTQRVVPELSCTIDRRPRIYGSPSYKNRDRARIVLP